MLQNKVSEFKIFYKIEFDSISNKVNYWEQRCHFDLLQMCSTE